jgi:hypothetical protein
MARLKLALLKVHLVDLKHCLCSIPSNPDIDTYGRLSR